MIALVFERFFGLFERGFVGCEPVLPFFEIGLRGCEFFQACAEFFLIRSDLFALGVELGALGSELLVELFDEIRIDIAVERRGLAIDRRQRNKTGAKRAQNAGKNRRFFHDFS